MNERLTIVSGGDTKYFELLKDLLFSLKNLEIKDDLDIYFLDGGLQESEKVYFSSFGVSVIDPGWPNKLSKIKAGKKNHLKVNFSAIFYEICIELLKTVSCANIYLLLVLTAS